VLTFGHSYIPPNPAFSIVQREREVAYKHTLPTFDFHSHGANKLYQGTISQFWIRAPAESYQAPLDVLGSSPERGRNCNPGVPSRDGWFFGDGWIVAVSISSSSSMFSLSILFLLLKVFFTLCIR
jgi:hypothetical protein